MFLVPVAVLSAAAASLAYFLMKPKEEEYDYDSDESAMSDMSRKYNKEINERNSSDNVEKIFSKLPRHKWIARQSVEMSCELPYDLACDL